MGSPDAPKEISDPFASADGPASPGAGAPGASPKETPTQPGAESPPPAAARKPSGPEVERTRVIKQRARDKRLRARLATAVRLIVARPDIPPAPLELTRDRTLIGRDPDTCDVVLEDSSVSRQHASVTKEPSGYYVLHDLGSRNGVFVKGHRISRRTLMHGDQFVVGETTITFEVVDPPQQPNKP